MKKILLAIVSFTFIVILCSCGNQIDINKDFVDGSLLFDMGANSMHDVEYCKIIDDGDIPEIFIGEDDFYIFAKYRYKCDYPSDKLHEILVFPTNKLLNISVDDKTFALYLRENGDICVRISEQEGFKVYETDKNNRITAEKYDRLIKKYGK